MPGWSSRALWMPAVAVVLPCVFIGVLAWQWIALQRENSDLRVRDAAERALGTLRHDLRAALADRAAEVAGSLPETSRAIPDGPSDLPISAAFIFDGAGSLLYPAPASEGGTVPASGADHTRADALLSEGSAALAAGRAPVTERTAERLLDCCARLRDDKGSSYAFYGRCQLATARMTSAPSTRATVVAQAQSLADAGHFDWTRDLTAMRLLVSEKLVGVDGTTAQR